MYIFFYTTFAQSWFGMHKYSAFKRDFIVTRIARLFIDDDDDISWWRHVSLTNT